MDTRQVRVSGPGGSGSSSKLRFGEQRGGVRRRHGQERLTSAEGGRTARDSPTGGRGSSTAAPPPEHTWCDLVLHALSQPKLQLERRLKTLV